MDKPEEEPEAPCGFCNKMVKKRSKGKYVPYCSYGCAVQGQPQYAKAVIKRSYSGNQN